MIICFFKFWLVCGLLSDDTQVREDTLIMGLFGDELFKLKLLKFWVILSVLSLLTIGKGQVIKLEISSARFRYNLAFSLISCFLKASVSNCTAGIRYSMDCR